MEIGFVGEEAGNFAGGTLSTCDGPFILSAQQFVVNISTQFLKLNGRKSEEFVACAMVRLVGMIFSDGGGQEILENSMVFL